ncbi:LicD family protein [Aneurinibacillus migulanus]|uniref:LicD family protein n=1 Tax=Aneurinibacillus migulanus TaxID=47500 RepID=A0A0D1XJJ6_ANEMI|nr:LicD family protein [Aneurinibacillus migulanus]KIV52433.1 hypothetical protein TS65_23805 [Aneurinibacillus migulanus]KON94609.1 hypothetical protein AF333_02985 [Aneurinibacillus migulanus]MED0892657.1 LicD family protein [Aneurinibacillus migulanus]MED1614298.1 LicD family protein [Aneurinibacillus migulanus]SDI47872.1 LicD family protein [Aneurinibacillus migulanus]
MYLEDVLKKRIIVFGTGKKSNTIAKSPLIGKVTFYVDNNRDKWGEIYNKAIIKNPDDLLLENKSEVLIVIASMYYEQISDQLREMGFIEDKHYVSSDKIIDEKHSLDLLRKIKEIFEFNHIKYWLDNGTLLGTIRDKKLIEWDKDLDIGIWKEYETEVLTLLHEYFSEKYIIRIDQNQNCIELREKNNIFARIMDITTYEVREKYAVRQWNFKNKNVVVKVPKEFFLNLSNIKLGDCDLSSPANAEEYLQIRYGADWHTPRRKWNYIEDDVAISEVKYIR